MNQRPFRKAQSPSDASLEEPLLKVVGLRVDVAAGKRNRGEALTIIDEANLVLPRRAALGIVGESGSGKSMLCRALIGTLGRHGASVTGGRLLFEGQDLAGASERTWRTVRGRRIGYIPQSSLAGLNPVLSVGAQMLEAVTADTDLSRSAAKNEAVRLLELVQLPRARELLAKRSHELSGGMRQRVMIAAALARRPALLVADEPTTALDVSVQRDILTMLGELRRELSMGLILVSHDIAVIEEVCERVMVMYAGATVEEGPIRDTVADPRHPYTAALLASRVDTVRRGEDLPSITGEPPMVGSWPGGCRFGPRCHMVRDDCVIGQQPGLRSVDDDRLTACLHAERMAEDAHWYPARRG